MSPAQNVRTTVGCRKALPAHAKPTKPPALNLRKTSTAKIASGPASSKSTSKQSPAEDTEYDDMAALPQFCAMCEKQMVNPSQSILYCSESCRKRDHNKPLSQSILPPSYSPQHSSRRTSYLGDEAQTGDLYAMYSPRSRRPPSLAFSDASDVSPTFDRRPSLTRNNSEAAQYLSQFRSYDFASENGHWRPNHDQSRTSTSNSITPSLSHTPSSFISTSTSYTSARPLQRRTDPYSASFSSLSVDLVIPVVPSESLVAPSSLSHANSSLRSGASTTTAFRFAEGEMSYDKKPYAHGVISPSRGSLKQLFSHDAIKAPPKPAEDAERATEVDSVHGDDDEDK